MIPTYLQTVINSVIDAHYYSLVFFRLLVVQKFEIPIYCSRVCTNTSMTNAPYDLNHFVPTFPPSLLYTGNHGFLSFSKDCY